MSSIKPGRIGGWLHRVRAFRLGRLARYVILRILLLPGEIILILAVLFVFGTYIPDAAFGTSPCALGGFDCSGCNWSSLACSVDAFGFGFGSFVVRMFTGQWGFASFGYLTEPAVQYVEWWLPYSVELAGVALLITIAIAFPLGLLAGFKRESTIDLGARTSGTIVLLVPAFLLALVVYSALYGPFLREFGDSPYGILPNSVWFYSHGGYPSWIGPAASTRPTGFPIVDSILNHDWLTAEIVILKTALQGSLIALTYAQIYLRYFRQSVIGILDSYWVTAARAKGLTDSQVIWHHLGRRALPISVLVFASTIPAFVGTQMIVEVLANDPGLGPILLNEMAGVIYGGFGFTQSVTSGNFWQVLIFLSVVLILLARIAADTIARFFDPRLLEPRIR